MVGGVSKDSKFNADSKQKNEPECKNAPTKFILSKIESKQLFNELV